MTSFILTDELVEKAALGMVKAHIGGDVLHGCDAKGNSVTTTAYQIACQSTWRNHARAALSAVLPDVIERCAKVAEESCCNESCCVHDAATAIRSLNSKGE